MIKKLFFLLVLSAVVVLGFYEWEALRARSMLKEANLPKNYHNAVKHALAARTVYRTLDKLGISNAEDKVMWLGEWNERVETYVKFNKPDSTLEMMKDSYNNLAGVTAAKFEIEKGKICKVDPIVILARSGGLRITAEEVKVPDGEREKLRSGQDLKAARAWLHTQYFYLQGRMIKRLSACEKA